MRRVPSCIPDNLLPPDMVGFVAGGYAACPELASDIDLWVNESKDDGEPDLVVRRQNILDYLTENAIGFVEQQNTRTELVDGDGYEHLPVTILKVATVPHNPLPIHIMVVDAPVTATLMAFDISTHQIAINRHDEIVHGPDWTDLSQEPIAFRMTTSTPDRLDKITKRYAHLRKAA